MAILSTGPCQLDGWPLQTGMGCWDIPADTPQETIDFWHRVAVEYLYMATGQRLGESCEVAVRPCRKRCADNAGLFPGGLIPAGWNGSPWIPYIGGDGQFRNASACGCTTDCNCGSELCEIELPGPIFNITQVDIGGTVLDPGVYFSYDARFLVLRPEVADVHPALGITCWPDCQDLSQPPGRPNTFTVTYSTGQAVPFMGAAAATELTAHYIKGCSGCGCGIGAAKNLSRMSRQGVELEFVSAQEAFGDGRTGLELVDRFVQTYNPGRLPRAMRVLSPDYKRPRLWMGY